MGPKWVGRISLHDGLSACVRLSEKLALALSDVPDAVEDLQGLQGSLQWPADLLVMTRMVLERA
jgi:hypothetical protein